MRWLIKTKKAALKTRAAALLSSKLGKPSNKRGEYFRPTPGGDYHIAGELLSWRHRELKLELSL